MFERITYISHNAIIMKIQIRNEKVKYPLNLLSSSISKSEKDIVLK